MKLVGAEIAVFSIINTHRIIDHKSDVRRNLGHNFEELRGGHDRVIFSAFLGVFAEVMQNVEGFARPLELVSADFLKHSVEIVRIIGE